MAAGIRGVRRSVTTARASEHRPTVRLRGARTERRDTSRDRLAERRPRRGASARVFRVGCWCCRSESFGNVIEPASPISGGPAVVRAAEAKPERSQKWSDAGLLWGGVREELAWVFYQYWQSYLTELVSGDCVKVEVPRVSGWGFDCGDVVKAGCKPKVVRREVCRAAQANQWSVGLVGFRYEVGESASGELASSAVNVND